MTMGISDFHIKTVSGFRKEKQRTARVFRRKSLFEYEQEMKMKKE